MGKSQVDMGSLVYVGDYVFTNMLSKAEIHSSWKSLTDTATLTLPNLTLKSTGEKFEKLVKVGDAVQINFGYDGELVTEYEGYVSEIVTGSPVVLKCEDEMWKLKQRLINKSWRSIKLADMLAEIVPGATIECPDVTLAPFRLENVSAAKALEKLKEEFLLVAYFRGKKLFVGLAYQEKGLGEVNYHFQKNAIMGDLAFRRQEDIRVRIKAISVMPNNKKISVEVGDGSVDENGNGKFADADQVTVHYYNKTKDELKVLAKEAINRIKYDGYRGAFKSKWLPFAIHSMVANLMNDRYPERAGSYFIDSVNTSYGPDDGIDRELELGRSATSNLIE